MQAGLSGWLVIDKPEGVNSTRVVAIVRKLLNTRKVGHAGTLDPFASGVLPIAIGEATKTVAYAQQHSKEYCFTLQFGETRDTEDREGMVVATSDIMPSETAIRDVLPGFIGVINQVPPRYSAIKVAGKRSYALARAGSQHELLSRKVEVSRFELQHYSPEERTATFFVLCGKGTYIRSLARDVATALGACGYVSMLRRVRVGEFSVSRAILLANLEEIVHNQLPNRYILPVGAVLDDIPACSVSDVLAERLRNGQRLSLQEVNIGEVGCDIVRIVTSDRLVALAKTENGVLKPVRVFNH